MPSMFGDRQSGRISRGFIDKVRKPRFSIAIGIDSPTGDHSAVARHSGCRTELPSAKSRARVPMAFKQLANTAHPVSGVPNNGLRSGVSAAEAHDDRSVGGDTQRAAVAVA